MKIVYRCVATALNLRETPAGTVFAELLYGDLVDVEVKQLEAVWTRVSVLSGLNAGREGYVRRKWIAQKFDDRPAAADVDRRKATTIIEKRTAEFDAVRYKLGDKAKTWAQLRTLSYVDCSGWTFLLAQELIAAYSLSLKPGALYTHSDMQVTASGRSTKRIVSGDLIVEENLEPGCLIGIDFAEYSWDRNRPLDIDHVVMVGGERRDKYVTQSSSSGGGVNRVPLKKWLDSTASLRRAGRMHMVDLLEPA